MALNIDNQDVERLLAQIVRITGESQTEALRQALAERLQQLRKRMDSREREVRLMAFLEDEVWPLVPEALLGTRPNKAGVEDILGYGEHGV